MWKQSIGKGKEGGRDKEKVKGCEAAREMKENRKGGKGNTLTEASANPENLDLSENKNLIGTGNISIFKTLFQQRAIL